MASGTTVFQTAVTATPPSGLPIMADSVNDTDHGVGTVQYIKIMDGATGGTIKAGVSALGLAVAGTFQPLAGSVHLASGLPGTVQALGSVQTVGTSQVLGTVQTTGTVSIGTIAGTIQALGTFQPLAGSVHLASGTVQILGTVQPAGTAQVLGSIQTVGTSQVLGSVQAVGPLHVGSGQRLAGTVLTRDNQAGEGFIGTIFTAGVTNGTLIPAPAAGTFVRIWDVMVSGSGAGSAFLELGDGTPYQQVFLAANGGYAISSARGVRTNGTRQDILFNCASGSWGVSVSYTLETL